MATGRGCRAGKGHSRAAAESEIRAARVTNSQIRPSAYTEVVNLAFGPASGDDEQFRCVLRIRSGLATKHSIGYF